MTSAEIRSLLSTANSVCPLSDSGWLAVYKAKILTAANVLLDARIDLRAAERPDWHAENRRARINAATRLLRTAQERVDSLAEEIRGRVADWQAGERIYDDSATAVGRG
jgi:hypothetical protein